MKLDKLWNGLKQIANGDYIIEGDLISEETIEIDLDDRLVVRGSVVSKKGIMIRCGIEAGEGIEAKTFIHSEKRIFAGVSVYHTNQNCIKTIQCAELRKGEVTFGELIIKEPEVIMTVAEFEVALGIKNLKIKTE